MDRPGDPTKSDLPIDHAPESPVPSNPERPHNGPASPAPPDAPSADNGDPGATANAGKDEPSTVDPSTWDKAPK